MGFWNDVTPQTVENAEDSGFKKFKIGDNEAYVKSIIEKDSSNGNPMLVIIFANDEGAEVRHYIVDGEFKLSKLKQFYIACGIPLGSSDVASWKGKRCIVVCKEGKPDSKGNTYNEVSYLRPLYDNQQQSSQQQNNSQPQGQPANNASNGNDFADDIPF